jgi:hypothetical protein
MMFRIDDEFKEVRPDAFYGGLHTPNGLFEYLYRLSDNRWFLHTVNVAKSVEPTFREMGEEEAVGWLIKLQRLEELSAGQSPPEGSARVAPDWVVPSQESYLRGYGRLQYCCPPPIGQHVAIDLPTTSESLNAIKQRQSVFLKPNRVLQNVMWPTAAEVDRTKDFHQHLHDPLVRQLQEILEGRLLEHPRISILQSLHDRGVDLLVEWPNRGKYGVQLKSDGDVEEKDFAARTLVQIQDSHQHSLERLYVVIAADIREIRNGKKLENSKSQKVRGLMSRISSMNDPYIIVVPPERAWTLLFAR